MPAPPWVINQSFNNTVTRVKRTVIGKYACDQRAVMCVHVYNSVM